jgi:prolyl-tRNA editing enzyme YbaK/EbsC (Cys-tRNA(Pro) deacylase)
MSNAIKLETLHNLLKNGHADYSILTDDCSIRSATSGAEQYGISLSETAPTLILKTKDSYIAAIICGDTRISFKKLRQILNIKDISMADPQTIFNITGAKIGEVSLVNPGLTTVIDTRVLQNKNCYGGCGVPKTTLRINTQDLVKATHAQIGDFTDPRS